MQEESKGHAGDVGDWAFLLYVEVKGTRSGREAYRIYRTSHPGMGEWGRQATAKMTGIPTSIGAQLLAHGEGHGTGVLAPEAAFDPTRFIAELARRGIRVEERIEEHGIIDDRSADALSRGFVATSVRVANDGKSSQL